MHLSDEHTANTLLPVTGQLAHPRDRQPSVSRDGKST